MKILNLEGQEILKLDLGTLEAGQSKEYSYVVYNDTFAHVVELEISTTNEEVKVINVPDSLSPQQKATFNIVWKSSIDVKKALETILKIQAKELYKPKN